MVVVVHQAIRVHPRTKALAQLAQQFQEVEMVGVIAENVLAFVATRGIMIAPVGPCAGQRARAMYEIGNMDFSPKPFILPIRVILGD